MSEALPQDGKEQNGGGNPSEGRSVFFTSGIGAAFQMERRSRVDRAKPRTTNRER